MFHLNGKKYPESAAEAARKKGQESMKCVYAGPEQMPDMEERMKGVYAGPEQMEIINGRDGWKRKIVTEEETAKNADVSLREILERTEPITKVVYAPPGFLWGTDSEGISPNNQDKV